MGEQGYEVTGDQMCVAGARYRELLKKRTVDLVRNHGVAYFKWDGFQFSCSEPDHGHAIGLPSRRATMATIEEMSRAVRTENPEIFLNITSGTWLSPWWLKYANTIWMQGRDYGYSDVPSISRRDRAITYRDVVLYQDFRKIGAWFPIANLMTHGIIKGHLQKLGGEAEPLDKFTDNAVLYFARGVAMWELYVSPNLLTDGEWQALAQAITWARNRFDVLMRTEMVGGDPGAEEAYGYAHFLGTRGVVTARNPGIRRQALQVDLSEATGLDPSASSLVVERVYPTRWVAPRLYATGDTLELGLDGYETAIYEIYPISEAPGPLLVDAVFAPQADGSIKVLETTGEARLIATDGLTGVRVDGKHQSPDALELTAVGPAHIITGAEVGSADNHLKITFGLGDGAENAILAILLRPEDTYALGALNLKLDGNPIQPITEAEEGGWTWVTVPVESGSHSVDLTLDPAGDQTEWIGAASAWLIYLERPSGPTLELEVSASTSDGRPMPPSPWPLGALRRTVELGTADLRLGRIQ
jgi:hypothetical protein